MTRLQTAWRVAAAAAAATLILASCGEGDDTGGGDGDAAGGGDATETTGQVPQGDGELVIGSLLPKTGDLAFLGPPEFAGVDLAIKDINAAGGVLGKPVRGVDADSGDGSPAIEAAETDKLLNRGSDVIVGAAASDISMKVIDKITTAGVVHFSPANTSPEFDTHEATDMYRRTAPSDLLQGSVLGNMVVDDGYQNVAILARQDSYGENLADQVEKTVKDKGATVAAKVLYSSTTQQFTSEAQDIAASNPDAVVVIGFQETTKIIPRLIAEGVGPQDVQTYFVDGNTSNYGGDFPPGTLAGVKATFPGAELTSDFRKRLLTVNPNLNDFTYGPESYDATIMSALGSVAAESDAGEAIAPEIVNISREGTKCTEFAECAELLRNGEDIDYDGVSGPVDLNDTGSPAKATIGIFQYNRQNNYHNIKYVTGVIE